MWVLDCEEGWALKNWCFWTVVLEKTLESPLDCTEIQAVHSEGDQPWDFFRRNDAEAETPVLWPPHAKSWLIGRLWCWEGLGAGGEGDGRGWDGWMASLTLWTWVWVKSGSWWWTGRPGVLWFMGSQRVGHKWVTELKHTCTHTHTGHIPWKATPSEVFCLHFLMQKDLRVYVAITRIWSLVLNRLFRYSLILSISFTNRFFSSKVSSTVWPWATLVCQRKQTKFSHVIMG